MGAPAGAGGGLLGPLLGATLVVLLAVVVPLGLAHHYGALGIPRSDDWSYLVSLFRLVDDGRLSFNHWVSMTLVGQLALATPVAAVAPDGITAQQVQTALVGLVGLGALGVTARRLGVDRPGTLLVVGGIAFGPLWGPLAVSFMTDVPMFTSVTLAMLLAVAGWRRAERSTGLLAASVVVSCLGFTIRQYAIVPAAAVCLLAAAQARAGGDRTRARRWLLALAAVVLATVAFLAWWHTVPDGRSLSPRLPTSRTLRTVFVDGAGLLRVTALLCLPVLVWIRPWRRVRRAWTRLPVGTLAVAGTTSAWLAFTAVRYGAFVGNYLEPDGVLADIVLVGRRPDVLPGPVWALVVAGASVAAVVLAVVALAGVADLLDLLDRRTDGPPLVLALDPARLFLGVTVAGFGAAYLGAMATGLQVYDRYALPIGAAVGLLLATTPRAPVPSAAPARATAGAVAALAAVALLGIAFTADSASFDGARWRVATAATAAGWPARTVNGGFEWRNFHRGDKLPALTEGARRRREPVCVTVHVNPRRVPGAVIATTESSAPTRDPARLVAYRTATPCPGLPRPRP